MRRDDFINIYQTQGEQDVLIYKAPVAIDKVRPEESAWTEAGAERAPAMRITLRYSNQLDPVIKRPDGYTLKLSRRTEVNVSVISIARSQDLRMVEISI